MSSFSNPRRRSPMAGSESGNALTLKTTMTLRKGATFHSPTSPSSSSEDAFVPPPLVRRSQTNLDDVVDAHRRRVALIVDNIDKSLSKPSKTTSSPTKQSFRDNSIPVPRGFLDLPIVDPAMAKDAKPDMERRVLRPRHARRPSRQSDSGLGTSVASTHEKRAAQPATKKEVKASAITRSAAASSSAVEKLPALSSRAVNRIHEHTLRPLLAKPSLKAFEPIVLDVPRRIRDKEIICLRDLEKTLIFMAPERTKSAALYLDFCLASIRCIQATVEYLSDREQTRVGDRPYTNGYFIDLVEQIRQYAGQLAAAKEKKTSGADLDEMDIDSTDEIKLYGGLAENGRPAELVRINKDGKAVSMATGEPVDLEDEKGPIKLKRSLSQQLEDDEEIMRSMARRKKNATPEELAPKKCREPGCNKEFKRPCDLTKHEKTHSRPWKCPVPTCKYHEYGWPTEKEMDRHHNDKHSSAPPMYECLFKPCPYKSKRESNCKQHMEKAHGWTYLRTKTNGKKPSSKDGSVTHATPLLGNMPTPSSNPSIATPPQDSTGRFVSFSGIEFPSYMSDDEFIATIGGQQPHAMDDIQIDLSPFDHSTPSTDASFPYSTYQEGPDFIVNEDIYGATAQLPTPDQSAYKIMADPYQYTDVCAPQPVPHISPIGQGNAMLYTPNSLADVDEGFEDFPTGGGMDFQLFPSNPVTKVNNFTSLFGEMPSAGLGFSQPSQQDMFHHQIDWSTVEYQAFPDQH